MEVRIEKQIFSKDDFNSTIDKSFTQLKSSNLESSIDISLSINNFFNLYDKLFFEIPKEGDINSHRFLVDKSTQYIGSLNEDNIEDDLFEEIYTLRTDNLELRKINLDLNIENSQLKTQISSSTLDMNEIPPEEPEPNTISIVSGNLNDDVVPNELYITFNLTKEPPYFRALGVKYSFGSTQSFLEIFRSGGNIQSAPNSGSMITIKMFPEDINNRPIYFALKRLNIDGSETKYTKWVKAKVEK